MSMNLSLMQATEIELARFAREGVDPDRLMGNEGPEVSGEQITAIKQQLATAKPASSDPEMLRRWQSYQQTMTAQLEAAAAALKSRPKNGADESTRPPLNLDKSWHLLHYLFTGRAWDGPMPAAALLVGGREVGEDLGYGPARTLSAQETKAFAQFLARQTMRALAGRIDPGAMQRLGIYCAEDAGARDELEEDVAHYFPQLQTYVGEAATKGCGLLIWMS